MQKTGRETGTFTGIKKKNAKRREVKKKAIVDGTQVQPSRPQFNCRNLKIRDQIDQIATPKPIKPKTCAP